MQQVFPLDKSVLVHAKPVPTKRTTLPIFSHSPRLNPKSPMSPFSDAFFTPRQSPSMMDAWFDAPDDISSFLLSSAMIPALPPKTPNLNHCFSPGMVQTLGLSHASEAELQDLEELPESATLTGSERANDFDTRSREMSEDGQRECGVAARSTVFGEYLVDDPVVNSIGKCGKCTCCKVP
ncbi:hypothetical protein HDU98_011961 [Podochytrium sp. JEL0797]|nr:hypothetical protein HDU98_011961 [Podochytrium sp. JEL0797]